MPGTKNSNRPSSYRKISYIQKIASINRKLRAGDIPKLAESGAGTASHITNVISGRVYNEKITNKFYHMTRGRKTNSKVLSKISSDN
jgi:hypothetical protein